MQIIGIILAGGKGTRFKSEGENKTAAKLQGKPLVMYGVELFEAVTEKVVVVVGAFVQSVKDAIGERPGLIYAFQTEPLGTGHALKTAVDELVLRHENPEVVVVGYADHMMFYKPETVSRLVSEMMKKGASAALLSTDYSDPNILRWGRIVRDGAGNVLKIIEQKDATPEELAITEVNPGLYCFKFDFLRVTKDKIQKSPVTGEYYINEFVGLAAQLGLPVVAYKVPFAEVGIGVNTREELAEDEDIKKLEKE